MNDFEPPPPESAPVGDLTLDATSSPAPLLSFVVPTMNEEQTVVTLVEKIHGVCQQNGYTYEVIFVDDGSTDATWQRMRELATQRGEVTAIRFRRNFGKAAALSAGFKATRGTIVFTMDADLQDDPIEVPSFLAKLDEGFDVVSGWKQKRKDSWDKVYPSKVFNWLVSTMTGVRLHDHNCGFKAYRRGVIEDVRLYGELHRFVPVLAAAQGWRVGQIPVVHHEREFGSSKYGVARIVKGFLDLLSVFFLTTFGKRPLHLIGTLGLLCFTIGGVVMMYLSSRWVITRVFYEEDSYLHLHQSALFYYCIVAILLGSQLFLTGLLAELIVAESDSAKRPYNISEAVGSNSKAVGTNSLAVGTNFKAGDFNRAGEPS
ncbi:glycosyltransferase [Stieleria varia]|uniref:Undecaprenyl-phosphate 4-deoxy-4-formamido-L-arabinose transferase n=1 Tax=Stieleria varia TaxID=2528005 RepID=A0A5C6ASS4_9BACT|nr:glycosyltransferase [Stieleria varia]TWU02477.1 Undecaprenyl-phosphate 4-deoxy-4-formamido-L-arabinose transferase [Stieleria varia]